MAFWDQSMFVDYDFDDYYDIEYPMSWNPSVTIPPAAAVPSLTSETDVSHEPGVPQSAAPVRKRSYSAHLDGGPAQSFNRDRSKSARTTPIPVVIDLDGIDDPSPLKPTAKPRTTAFGFPSTDFIDLTGDDDDVERVLQEEKRRGDAMRAVEDRLGGNVDHGQPGAATKPALTLQQRTSLLMPQAETTKKLADRPAQGRSLPSSDLAGNAHAHPSNTMVAQDNHNAASPHPSFALLPSSRQLPDPMQPSSHCSLNRTRPVGPPAASPSSSQASPSYGRNTSYRVPGSYNSYQPDDEADSGELTNGESLWTPNSHQPSVVTPSPTGLACNQPQGSAPHGPSYHLAVQPTIQSFPSSALSGLTNLVAGIAGTLMPNAVPLIDAVAHDISPSTAGVAPHPVTRHDSLRARGVEDVGETNKILQLIQNIGPEVDTPAAKCEVTPEALRVTLMPHQKLALKWMKAQEDGATKGGILADEMGLGKTVSMLSLLLSRPAPEGAVKTNLIVGPVSLIRQWEDEINEKIKPGHKLRVLLFHNRKAMTFADLQRYDVVLTTYGTISSETKRMAKYRAEHENEPNFDFNDDPELQKKCPLLHSKSTFHRLVLDEAHYIKNEKTKTAEAAHRLKAKHRWCLTGTPMQNGVHELYSLLCFVRVEPYTSLSIFNKHFGALSPNARAKDGWNKNQGMKQLHVVLKASMLRRTKKSQIDGKPILELPPKTEETARVVFSKDERDFYTDLETKSREKFNIYQRAGTIRKNYHYILVLLLRLRQSCGHPHMIYDLEFITPDPEKVELAKGLAPHVVETMKANMSPVCPICLEPIADPLLVVPCGHSLCSECLAGLPPSTRAPDLASGEPGVQLDCPDPGCRVVFRHSGVINSATFKSVHMAQGGASAKTKSPAAPSATIGTVEEDAQDDDSSDTAADDGLEWTEGESESDEEQSDADENGNLAGFVVGDDDVFEDEVSSEDENLPRARKGREWGSAFRRGVLLDDDNDDDDDEEFVPIHAACRKRAAADRKSNIEVEASPLTETVQKKANGKKNKGKKKREKVTASMLTELRKRAVRSKTDRARYMKYLSDNWITSAKVDMCTKLLFDIHKTGEKTLVFSVWTVMLDLLEVAIRKELGLRVLRYDGSQSMSQRAEAVQRLRDDPDMTIMLLSLKAGNAGLNLTVASHVIICDPYWNPAIELQAVDRAHRIGQERPLHVHRLLVGDTIEDRIVQLQQKKRALVEAALDEKELREISRLSVRDMAMLFGSRA